jgi:polar amino acid transport system substrate-binding protein
VSRFRALGILVVAATAVTIAGCGGSSGGTAASAPTAASTADSAIAAQVPAAIKSAGTLTAATDASYAPNEFTATNGKTIIGMDVDLIDAIGGAMGLKVTVTNAQFDGIIPGLAAGKYDVGISSFTDNAEREKTVDFVTYFSAGTSFFTKATGGATVSGLDDLCGKTVAVEKGTTQADDATAQSAKCSAAGKPAVTVDAFPDQSGANLALSSGRAQVSMADSPVADYQVKLSNGQFKLVGTPYGTAPYGIAIPKKSGLAPPILAAVKKLIADGTYKKILDKWGVGDGAITTPVINGAGS